MGTVDGATLMARSLKQQGVDFMFGIIGFPVPAIAAAAQKVGITYIGMRNEQSASYAAHAAGYMTGRPQACLTVSGPGVIHAFAGLANAQQNCWPMILIGGASPIYQNGMGAFQEERQVELASPYCKYAHAIEATGRIPYYVEQAVRHSIFGRPGAVYLDFPDDIIRGEVDEADIEEVATVPEPPRPGADPDAVEEALSALESAERPLVIVGKGMAWARAEDEVREFIERTQLPFLASPMGKGVMPDDDPLSVGAGARLNWIMHFGLPPRFNKDVRVVQLDIAAEEIGTNVATEVALVGDGKAVTKQLNRALDNRQWFYPADTDWRSALKEKADGNAATVKPMVDDDSAPAGYYRAFRDIQEWLPRDAIIIGEGANTMDIGRTQMLNYNPRSRLDAGTYGTMGIGLGFAVAAAVTNPGKAIVSVQGDSAFGFSGMEIETMARYNLPVKMIVLNNGGIGGGIGPLEKGQTVPPGILTYGARYEKFVEALGGKGWYIADPKDLRAALDEAMAFDGPTLINVPLSLTSARKPQEHGWLTT